jgi:hypothetical protein
MSMTRLAVEALIARTRAHKAAGTLPTYPHAGKKGTAGTPSAKPAPKRGPCRHKGAELTGKEREARNLSHGRTWSLCLHPVQPLGAAVSTCKGCGQSCRGYESAGV